MKIFLLSIAILVCIIVFFWELFIVVNKKNKGDA